MLSRPEKVRILYSIPWWAEYMATERRMPGKKVGAPSMQGRWRNKEARERTVAWLRANPSVSFASVSTGGAGVRIRYGNIPAEVVAVCVGIRWPFRRGKLPAEVLAEFGDLLRLRTVRLAEPERLRKYVAYVRGGGVTRGKRTPRFVAAVYSGLRRSLRRGYVFSQETADILGDLLPKGAKVEDHALQK